MPMPPKPLVRRTRPLRISTTGSFTALAGRSADVALSLSVARMRSCVCAVGLAANV